MQGIDIAEQLHLGSEIHELKLGPSIISNSTKFHTLKYDFKPASVDDSKVATVDVGSNNTISVTVPHLDGAGTPHTVFKGSQKPYHKEYVLILDKITGEITLERLKANIQVKKTRGGPKQNSNGNTLPINTMPVEIKNSPPYGRVNGRTKVISGKKREPSVQLHPKQNQTSPYDKRSPRNTSTNSYSPVQSSSGQSTLVGLPALDNDDFAISLPMIPASSSVQNRISPPPLPTINTKSLSTLESDSSSSSSSSDTSSSDSETETPTQTTNDHLNSATASPTLFMPNHFLNDDLQLSESESDSDSNQQ